MTNSLTKHPRRFEVRVYGETDTTVDLFYVDGDLSDVKRSLRDRGAQLDGRRVEVFKLRSADTGRDKPVAGRPPTVTYHRTGPAGPWLRGTA